MTTTPAQRIVIDPVTRIEGHAKITLFLGEGGEVEDAQFHVTQFRGFEKFTEGRPFTEMPALTARTCGICPVSHLIASSKACDDLLAVEIPPVAAALRRVLNLAQILQSHALSFYHLSSPDLLLGMDADPASRHLFGVLEAHPVVARDGIAMRRFGQRVIERLGGKRIHPAWTVPGGVSRPLSPGDRDAILAELPEARAAAERTLATFKPLIETFAEEIAAFANFPTLYLGLVGPDGELEHYDGELRVMGSAGEDLGRIEARRYAGTIAEEIEPYSYLKSPYYRPLGYPQGIYRVGPLARLNLARRAGTPRADEELRWFKSLESGPVVQSSFHFHAARLVEMLYITEKLEELLSDSGITGPHVRATGGVNRFEGVGVSEAPRGTLLHHYRVDEHGLMTGCNMIIATGHNNLAMNRGLLQVARRFVRGERVQEGALNRVEAVIRAYDPCLSCSTHAYGDMPLELRLLGPGGEELDRVTRSPFLA